MELPLFPLNTVLFPGETLPLHIFEERYKTMIGECLAEERPFGVLLIRSGAEVGAASEPFEVGTTATIVHAQTLEEGKMNLICVGGQRFRVVRRVQDQPYLVGEVETLESAEDASAETAELADTAGALFAEYFRLYLALSGQWARQIGMPGEAGLLSDFIASRLRVSLWTKQRLLEEMSVRNRLEMEIDLLGEGIRELTPQVTTALATRWRGFGALN